MPESGQTPQTAEVRIEKVPQYEVLAPIFKKMAAAGATKGGFAGPLRRAQTSAAGCHISRAGALHWGG